MPISVGSFPSQKQILRGAQDDSFIMSIDIKKRGEPRFAPFKKIYVITY